MGRTYTRGGLTVISNVGPSTVLIGRWKYSRENSILNPGFWVL